MNMIPVLVLIYACKNIHKYRFPTFQSVRLCVTAIDDIQRRTKIQKLVESNGGTYVDTIGKGIQLTHLVCGPDRGDKADERGFTAKMKFIEKMNNSATEKAHLVWEEWFWDCLEFKGLSILSSRVYFSDVFLRIAIRVQVFN